MDRDLVEVRKANIGDEKVNSVNARELWVFLESKQDFSDWIKKRIKQYDFVENQDFILFHKKMEQVSGAKYLTEYYVSLDMGKELAMVERNEKGKQIRKYFIACEKRLLKKTNSRPELASDLKANIEIAKLFGFSGNQALLSANKVTKKYSGVDLISEFDVKLVSENNAQYFTPTEIGIQNGDMSAKKVNRIIKSKGFQKETRNRKNKLTWVVTESGKRYCQILDTGKKYSNGTPIQQIKWVGEVLTIKA